MKQEKRHKNIFATNQITKMALLIAFLSAMSYVRIPLPFSDVAITGQTLAVNLIALLLTPIEAFITLLCYWLLGLVGAPVFGGAAGPGKLFGPGGGYFLAFMLAVFLISKWKGKSYHFGRYAVVTILVGLLVINGIGFVWMKYITGMAWDIAFLTGFVAFALFDIIKCIAACVVIRPIQKALWFIEDTNGRNVR